jgi:hypothetical protein
LCDANQKIRNKYLKLKTDNQAAIDKLASVSISLRKDVPCYDIGAAKDFNSEIDAASKAAVRVQTDKKKALEETK